MIICVPESITLHSFVCQSGNPSMYPASLVKPRRCVHLLLPSSISYVLVMAPSNPAF